jgi:GTP-binding protein HflX
VLVEDALFATLDPTTRRTQTADGRTYTLTDTVGFVRHLPHQLVDAFRSTLEEAADADLLVHVVDGSDPAPEEQVSAVREVLGEITRKRKEPLPPELLVINKTDASDEVTLARLRHALSGSVQVSARTGAGIAELVEVITDRLPRPEVTIEVLVPYARGELVARAHADGEVLEEEHVEEGTRLLARVRPDFAAALREYETNSTRA